METKMRNVAYTKEYTENFKKTEDIIFNKGKKECDDVIKELPFGYRLKSAEYFCAATDGHPYNLRGAKRELIKADNVVFTFESIDDDCDIAEIIHHSNRKYYFIFRKELYGYSVLEIDTMREFHYVPTLSFPNASIEGNEETFIWTSAFYNPINNILAVCGCYWACPFEIILIDFSDPFKPAEKQLNLCTDIIHGCGAYNDIDFVAWEGTDLVINAHLQKNNENKKIIIKQEEYINFFTS